MIQTKEWNDIVEVISTTEEWVVLFLFQVPDIFQQWSIIIYRSQDIEERCCVLIILKDTWVYFYLNINTFYINFYTGFVSFLLL